MMRSKSRTRRLAIGSALILAAATAIVAMPQVAQAYTTTGCSFGSSTNSVGVTGLPSLYNTSASSAVWLWSSQTDLNLTSVNSASVNGIVGDWGDNGLAGRATWTCWFGGTQGCTASLNRHYTDYYVSNKKRTVWLHELGHCFGLNHSSYATAVMRSCPACAYEAGQTGLHSDDKNGMNSLY